LRHRVVTDVLIRFPIIAQRSKGAHYFQRVVGLVIINLRQWDLSRFSTCRDKSATCLHSAYVCVADL